MKTTAILATLAAAGLLLAGCATMGEDSGQQPCYRKLYSGKPPYRISVPCPKHDASTELEPGTPAAEQQT